MAPESANRRLAAIVVMDVAGYARLMGADEEGTHARVKDLIEALVRPRIGNYRGRVIRTTGDGALVEFGSVIDAVRCMVALQETMRERNAELPAEERVEFRIGVHLGDVIAEEDDIYGEGVNIAARLEALAQPGGILASGAVREQVLGSLGFGFDDLGEQRLKNIARPVRIFRVHGSATAAEQPHGRSVGAAPRLSLVVLPFSNIGGGQTEEDFVDGVTDIITTDLSRLPGALVIARNTAFSYKGKSPDARLVGRDLGVRYVLEGSVQRSSGRLRVSTQLLDAETGGQLWAERYDRAAGTVFEMQDEITTRLASALDVHLVEAEARRSLRERPNNPDAIDLAMRGWSVMYRPHTPETLAEARAIFARALALDDRNVMSLVGMAEAVAFEVGLLWNDNPRESVAHALAAVRRALDLDPGSARAHYVEAILYRLTRRFDLALAAVTQALKLDRNLAAALAQRAIILIWMGQPNEAFAHVEEAIRLSPRDHHLYTWFYIIGIAHMLLGQFDTAIEWLLSAIQANPRVTHNHFLLAAAYCLTGRKREARAALAEYYKLRPGITITQLREEYRFPRPPAVHQPINLITSALEELGMPP